MYSNLDLRRKTQRESAKRRRDSINKTQRKQRRGLKTYVDSLKNLPCENCGESFPSCVMDFHHIGPKLFGIGQAANLRKTKEAIDLEVKKCVLLCANCHRIEHASKQSVV